MYWIHNFVWSMYCERESSTLNFQSTVCWICKSKQSCIAYVGSYQSFGIVIHREVQLRQVTIAVWVGNLHVSSVHLVLEYGTTLVEFLHITLRSVQS